MAIWAIKYKTLLPMKTRGSLQHQSPEVKDSPPFCEHEYDPQPKLNLNVNTYKSGKCFVIRRELKRIAEPTMPLILFSQQVVEGVSCVLHRVAVVRCNLLMISCRSPKTKRTPPPQDRGNRGSWWTDGRNASFESRKGTIHL